MTRMKTRGWKTELQSRKTFRQIAYSLSATWGTVTDGFGNEIWFGNFNLPNKNTDIASAD